MCLSREYIDRNGNREILTEEVVSVVIENDKILLERMEEAGALMKD